MRTTSEPATRRPTHRLVGNSFSSQEFRVQSTAGEQNLVQRGLSGGFRHVPLRLLVEVVLCDPAHELLDECGTCAVGAMSQVVHKLGRELQTSGVERYQLPA